MREVSQFHKDLHRDVLEVYERPAYVMLECNCERFDERAIVPLSIYEDSEGIDVVEFICPRCGDRHESYRMI